MKVGVKGVLLTSTKPGLSLCCATALVLTALSCGDGNSRSISSSPTPIPTPTPVPSTGATITITSNGVSPRSVTVSVGSRVTFVNNNTIAHDMSSNEHPEHTNCPAINQVGFLLPAQSRQTGNLNIAGTCGYHDHDQSTNASLQGTIVIQ